MLRLDRTILQPLLVLDDLLVTQRQIAVAIRHAAYSNGPKSRSVFSTRRCVYGRFRQAVRSSMSDCSM